MYYGSVGQSGSDGLDVMEEARNVLEGSCYSYSLDKCLWPDEWSPSDPAQSAVSSHPNCELLRAARQADGDGFQKLQDSLPYCEYEAPQELMYRTLAVGAIAVGVGIFVGALVF